MWDSGRKIRHASDGVSLAGRQREGKSVPRRCSSNVVMPCCVPRWIVYRLLGNQFVDYSEPGSAALSLYADRLGKAPADLHQDNLFQHCALPVQEAQKGLWEACRGRGNAFLECGGKPAELTASTANVVPQVVRGEPPTPAVLRAAKPARPIRLDGDVSEWPWSDKARVAVLRKGAGGAPYPGPKAFALAACDANALYVALMVALPHGYALKTGGGQYDGDGLELSLSERRAAVAHAGLRQLGRGWRQLEPSSRGRGDGSADGPDRQERDLCRGEDG